MTQQTVDGVREVARRIFQWYRDSASPAPEYLPKEFSRMTPAAMEAYTRDAEICIKSNSVEEAARRMYESFPTRTVTWDQLNNDSNPKRYYRARAKAGYG